MKVQNIAAMLREEGYEYSSEVSCLSGVPTGEKGRRTNWNIVANLTDIERGPLSERCKTILKYYGKAEEKTHLRTKAS